MKDKAAQSVEVNATVLQPSKELQTLLARLTAAQARGVTRIVEAEMAGDTLESVLTGPGKICNRATYWRENGWAHHTVFQEALTLARREARSQQMGKAIEEAIRELQEATPLAAADLRRQITGDTKAVDMLAAMAMDEERVTEERQAAARALGAIGSSHAAAALVELLGLDDEAVRAAAIEALGLAAAGTDTRRRLADVAVLDRADLQTASKGAGGEAGEDALSAEALEDLRRKRWEQAAATLQRATTEAAP